MAASGCPITRRYRTAASAKSPPAWSSAAWSRRVRAWSAVNGPVTVGSIGWSGIGRDSTRVDGVCGRCAQQRPASELAEIFGAEPLDDLDARFNVAPTDPALVVAQREDRRAIVAWG